MSTGRLFLVWAILLTASVGLGSRLYQLQIIEGATWSEKARRQRSSSLTLYVPRKSIVDRHDNVLAIDRRVYTLYAHPTLFKKSQEEIAAKIAPLLENYNPQGLISKFAQGKTGILLAKNLSQAQADKLNQLFLDGIETEPGYARFYPQEEMASEIVGYVQFDLKAEARQGKAGVESSYEKSLAPKPATLQSLPVNRDGHGVLILPTHLPDSRFNFNAQNLKLTIDLPLQRSARAALKTQIEKYKALRGAIIVMDVQDGSILTMVSEPAYDPNHYKDFDLELFKNWVISDRYEPGSTFKPINLAIALETGAIKANTVVNDPGKIVVDGWSIYNHDFRDKGAHGKVNLAQILQYSSNIGMIQIMQRMGKKLYYQKLKALDLETTTGIDLPGEVAGKLKKEAVFTKGKIEVATASFGQGFSLTPLKLLQLHAAIANGGKLVTPHVVQGIVDAAGQFQWQPQLKTKQVFSPQVTRTVLELMATVITDGSGKNAQIPGYRLAGKTGTAQKASPQGGYDPKAKITSFVAILPLEAPRYAILTLIDEPKGFATFGSTVAAPIAKPVMETLLVREKISPIAEQNQP